MTEQPRDSKPADGAPRKKPTRAQRIVGFTFLGAFGLTMLTVVLTGLNVRSPSSLRNFDTPAVVLTIGEPQTVHLNFAARAPITDAELTVALPPGVELASHPGEARVVSNTALVAGDNALPLTLVARSGSGGQLAAQLLAGDDRKTFVIEVTIAP